MTNVPVLKFDGQFIDVLWGNEEPVMRWFEQYFGWQRLREEDWKVDPRCLQGKMNQMNDGTWIISYVTNEPLPHHYAERGTTDPNIRLCFRVHDLDTKHTLFAHDGIKVSPIYDGAGPTRYFDFWLPIEGIRLTLQEDLSIAEDAILPSWIRIAVSKLEESVKWYEAFMGMSLVEDHSAEGYVIMKLKLNHHDSDSLWVIEQQAHASIHPIDGQVQPSCWIESRDEFFNYHQYLKDSGIATSDVGGFLTRGMVSFHYYDPDGNRLNISSM